MSKRDRWSSDDENEDEGNKSNGERQNDVGVGGDGAPRPPQQHHSASSSLTATSSSQHHLHNPLLHGSRSVYDAYTRLSHIDSGTYGIVWRAKCNATNEIVALKQIKFDDELVKEGFPISALREINVLLALKHPNIVHVKEVVVGGGMRQKNDSGEVEDDGDDNTGMEQPQIYMVMECLEMDLQRAMMTPDPTTAPLRGAGRGSVLPFAQSEVKFIMHQLLSAIEHIHSHWYLHRDIKTSNILLRRNGHLALCDFGLARKFEEPARAMTMSVVTLWYRAPELLFGECRYGPEIDMWR
jgi:cell division cycle 2-like protein